MLDDDDRVDDEGADAGDDEGTGDRSAADGEAPYGDLPEEPVGRFGEDRAGEDRAGGDWAGAASAGIDTGALLAEAGAERVRRQAYWHGTQPQLFAFLFANCLFFASAFTAWVRSAPGDPAGDPSTYITGLDTIRGGLIFALAIYGFWTAVFNIWHGQMKVWPYVLNAGLALWVGIAGFAQGIGGEQWDRAKGYLETIEDKKMLDEIMVPLSTVAPGYWLLSAGGLIVVWVILVGLMQGRQSAKTAPADEGGSRRRRR